MKKLTIQKRGDDLFVIRLDDEAITLNSDDIMRLAQMTDVASAIYSKLNPNRIYTDGDVYEEFFSEE